MFKWLEKMLENMAKANKENFGEERLDCCDLNQPRDGRKIKEDNKRSA